MKGLPKNAAAACGVMCWPPTSSAQLTMYPG